MLFKRLFATSFAALLFISAYADRVIQLRSPNGNTQLGINVADDGEVKYRVSFKNRDVVKLSGLGFNLKVPEVMLNRFELVSTDSLSFDQTWRPVWGEQGAIKNNYKQLTLIRSQLSRNEVVYPVNGYELLVIFLK